MMTSRENDLYDNVTTLYYPISSLFDYYLSSGRLREVNKQKKI